MLSSGRCKNILEVHRIVTTKSHGRHLQWYFKRKNRKIVNICIPSSVNVILDLFFTHLQYTQDVLGAFHSFKLDDASHRKRRERTEEELPSINPIPKLGDDNLYFAKYLTNRRLLELQMSDPNFRRYFLVQLIVILQYLTVPVKFKS